MFFLLIQGQPAPVNRPAVAAAIRYNSAAGLSTRPQRGFHYYPPALQQFNNARQKINSPRHS
ncbi:MAG: hypothetical protein EAZ16_13850 [Sphingobacteriales bacterium]|nr:MAG: hypothetical protein EAZ16_13850 [Sphingobacteriales bacterium]